MRKRKYRVWDTITKKMYYAVQVNAFGCPPVGYSFFDEKGTMQGSSPFDSKFSFFMDFTGLHDKNGNEIWESDIVKDPSEYGGIKVVRWNQAMCRFEFSKTLGYHISSSEKVKVIGNIYENPELLK